MNLKLLKRTVLNKGALWLSYLKLIPVLKNIGKGDVVLDCGANVGDITQKFIATGAQVYAFEPDPTAFDILQKRFQNTANVTLLNKGVWDRNTRLALYTHKDNSEGEAAYTVSSSIISNKVNVDASKARQIEVIDLTEFIANLSRRVNLIKLDVEGAETEILKKVIEKDTYQLFDAMYVETHETKIPGQKEELEAIRATMQKKGVTNIKLNWL